MQKRANGRESSESQLGVTKYLFSMYGLLSEKKNKQTNKRCKLLFRCFSLKTEKHDACFVLFCFKEKSRVDLVPTGILY